MAKSPPPIRPRVKDAKRFERAVRERFLTPWMNDLNGRLSNIADGTAAYHTIRQSVRELEARRNGGVPVETVLAEARRLEQYHRGKLIDTWRRTLGIDIAPVLTRPAVAAFMSERVGESVNLIRTIPGRFLDDMGRDLTGLISSGDAFDQRKLMRLVRTRYRSAGYNLRRITRDQTNKAIGGLSQIRQQELGVESYIWRTVEDERVRATHRANNGQTFQWAEPPATTGHPGWDIQCRCVPIAVVADANAARLGASTTTRPRPTPTPTPPPRMWNDDWRGQERAGTGVFGPAATMGRREFRDVLRRHNIRAGQRVDDLSDGARADIASAFDAVADADPDTLARLLEFRMEEINAAASFNRVERVIKVPSRIFSDDTRGAIIPYDDIYRIVSPDSFSFWAGSPERNYGRRTIEGLTAQRRYAILHELGHAMHRRFTDAEFGRLWRHYSKRLPARKTSWIDHAPDVSGYATSSGTEFTAEAYAATMVYGRAAPAAARNWIRFLTDPGPDGARQWLAAGGELAG